MSDILAAPYTSGIMQTVAGAASALFTFPISSPSCGALFVEVVGFTAAGDMAYTFKNVGIKNVGGTVTISGGTITNALSSPLADASLLTASVSIAGTTGNRGAITCTGPTSGIVVYWACWVTYKVLELTLSP